MLLHRVVQVKAVSFQDIELTYEFANQDQESMDTFEINPLTGVVTLKKKLTWVSDRRYFFFTVIAQEQGEISSWATAVDVSGFLISSVMEV